MTSVAKYLKVYTILTTALSPANFRIGSIEPFHCENPRDPAGKH